MMKFFLFSLLVASACSQSWNLVWNDEFDGTALNKTKWQNEVDCWGGGNNELQCYTARSQNIYVSNGNLVITAIQGSYTGTAAGCTASSGCTDTKPFTSARIRTLYDPAGSFLRGRVEMRAKLPKGKHLWPAFWMLPTDYAYGSWAASGEIDILEARGQEPTIVQSTLHHGGVWPNNVYTTSGKLDMGVDTSADYHIYAVEWEETQMRFYFDTKNIYTLALNKTWCPTGSTTCPYTKPGQPWDKKMHILLNLAVGGGFFNGYSALTDADVKAWTNPSFFVDYVRVYQRGSASATTSSTTATTDSSTTTGSTSTSTSGAVSTGSTGTTTSSSTTTGSSTYNADYVMLVRTPTTIVANGQFDVTVSYVASVSRDIVVDVLNSQTYAWFGKGIVNVPAGKGTVTVTISGVNSAPAGSNYQFKAWNVAAGVAGTDNDWTKAIDLDYRNVVVGSSLVYGDCA